MAPLLKRRCAAMISTLVRLPGILTVGMSVGLSGCGGDGGDSSQYFASLMASLKGEAIAPSTSVTLFVSPDGSGGCSQGSPCSLQQAQSVVRSKRAAGVTDVKVELADGTYRLAGTWLFSPADSGAPGHPVVWTAASGAHPVISGATQITNWTVGPNGIWSAPVPQGSNSRQLYINGAEALMAQQTPDQLGFKSGSVANILKLISEISSRSSPVPLSDAWSKTEEGYDIRNDTTAMTWFSKLSATQLSNIEFVYTQGNGEWTESRCRVSSYSNGMIVMAQPCWKNVVDRPANPYRSGELPSMKMYAMPTSIQNSLSLIQPGQWFLDTAAGTIYYYPIPGQKVSDLDFELPRLESLLQGVGALSNPLHDVTFSGLQFSYATWNDPSTLAGFADVQSNLRATDPDGQFGFCGQVSNKECLPRQSSGQSQWGFFAQPLANVSFSASNNITIKNNRFLNLGGAGLSFMFGSSGNVIENNEFAFIASTAISMGCTFDPNPDPNDLSVSLAIKLFCAQPAAVRQVGEYLVNQIADDTVGLNEVMKNNKISRNLIHNIGTDYPSAPGITLLFGQETLVTRNEIHDTPYTAITAGVIQGHLDNSTHPNVTTNVNDSNEISNNLLHHYMSGLNDGGAIYVEGHQAQYQYKSDGVTLDPVATLAHGLQVSGNYARDSNNTMRTFYDDAGAEWVNWKGNAEFNSPGQFGGVLGGCQPTGHIWANGNFYSPADGVLGEFGTDGLVNQFFGCFPGPIDVNIGANAAINSASQIPSGLVASAGRGYGPEIISETSIRGRIGDNASPIVYIGEWKHESARPMARIGPLSSGSLGLYTNDFLHNIHYTTKSGDSMKISFNGTAIQIFGEQSSDQGNIGISIDGGAEQIVNTESSDGAQRYNVAIYTSPILARGSHTAVVTKLSGNYATINGAYIFP
ncbi:right-handed parallel beta-helix repeat-containing protein [Burkholderia ambifaria]|uniref:right-handed parallel beta-helix repeat-containing protein n=1 Tax=Burkholderia ambifaria TaxID=152480 RepID=UPI00158D666B|nr:right-handed parallel beta-helix repeat-containing protein [Burkholderia ambifaria]